MKWFIKFIFLINILLVSLTVLAYLSPFVNPNLTWFFSFFGLGFPILLILNLGFILLWLMLKPKYVLLSALCLAIGFNAIKRTIGLHWPEEELDGFELMTYNIGHSRYLLQGKESASQLSGLKNFINETEPDVICLQERAKNQQPLYDDIFKEYTIYPDELIGTCIYSKWPVVNHGNIYFDTNAHNASWADIKVRDKTIRVYSIHLSSNKVKKMSDDLKEMWDESKFILDKYNYHAIKRTEQYLEIREHAKNSPHPVILAGDFNDMPQSYLYGLINKDFCDLFINHGSGLIKTHESSMPGLRIDYIFHDTSLASLGQKIFREKYSDHYALSGFFDL
ncbi:MAG: endonuclease/exonuclease/phosphatase family protein [Saprospiraceae bacterium]